ncbi:TPA: HesA/MoeB/ThiF family protein [Yersinia enterocolitica]|uniref:HesA/MoeB/ThiF family protein n=3 Tax=Yersinia enterocolitica TaxID=630 RepID=A0A0H5H751_YEREN|nr:HesA/MoeB/ThiF family protein [Yersinia enterocolitica]CBX73197.1 adenylyltransferase thiF [Yersinia enterocolitica W22703]ADZ40791.1 thiamine biosynthesis protein [Yersinia enterocolitica subsp. palearctica 105.5R(r)]ALG80315.1 molybdopterin-synthase adenylyltransferase [Yersinia enterocolitica]EHB19201.1 thiamine biosynthesis protein [Yersinia enterocolitica subsp. palearctica PhRBD_Ye1]EKN3315963.1 HesA/MoeB/ThiF family protein [Yersinia enterocolitica]
MSNTNEFSDKHELSDSEFLRYSRQLLLEDIGPEGQLKLKNARVLIIGLGGLGSPAALYLAAAGVGKLLLADDDQLDLSNLQRQILYRTTDINQPSASSHTKVRLAQHHLQNLNPLVEIVTFDIRLDDQALADAVAEVDLVLDCSDNMETRHQVNAACIKAQKTLISGSAVGFSGQLLVIEPPFSHGCYACLYPDKELPQRNCRTSGVLGPVVGIIGTLQALEAIKMLSGLPSALSGKLRLFDGKQQSWSTLQLTRAKNCPTCGGRT